MNHACISRPDITTLLLVHRHDMASNLVSIRLHGKGHVGAKPRSEVIVNILAALRELGRKKGVKRCCKGGRKALQDSIYMLGIETNQVVVTAERRTI